jgi:Spy/CpxP family protein refolding chaperone
MRRLCQIALLTAIAGFLTQSAFAQPPERGGGRRGGFRGGMAAGQVGMLLRNESVQKELKLDKDQVTKVNEAIEKVSQQHQGEFAKLRELSSPEERRTKGQELGQAASADALKSVSDILNKDQLARLKQIELQQSFAEAFTRTDVADALKLTDEQKTKIKTIIEDARKEAQEARQGGGGFGQGGFQRMLEMRKQTADKAVAVLTDDQKKTWKEMTGEPFHLQMPQFQGGQRRGPRPPTQQ